MKHYQKKPIVVEAVLWTGKNEREMFDFLTESTDQCITLEDYYFRIDLCNGGCQVGNLIIKTKEGDMKADIGDYVIKEPFPTDTRKFYPCKPDIFMSTYDLVINNNVLLLSLTDSKATIEKAVNAILENNRLVKIIVNKEVVIGLIIGNDSKDIDKQSEDLHYYILPIGNPYLKQVLELWSNVEAFPIETMGMDIDGDIVIDKDGVSYYVDIKHGIYKKLEGPL